MFQVTDSIQSYLSHAQAVYVVGLLVSPVKAMLSTAQLVAGFVVTVIFNVLSALCAAQPDSALAEYALATKLIAISGLENLEYSVSNFFSFGSVGRQREQLMAAVNDMFVVAQGFQPLQNGMHGRQVFPFPFSDQDVF